MSVEHENKLHILLGNIPSWVYYCEQEKLYTMHWHKLKNIADTTGFIINDQYEYIPTKKCKSTLYECELLNKLWKSTNDKLRYYVHQKFIILTNIRKVWNNPTYLA